MSCSSSGRTTSRLASGLLALAALLAATGATAADVARGADLERGWLRLMQEMDEPESALLAERTNELLDLASSLGLRRLTPYSHAMVARSRGLEARRAAALLRHAVRLDPGSPEAWFALSTAQVRDGAFVAAVASTVRGLRALFTDLRLAHVTWSSLALAGCLTGCAALLLWSLLALRRTFLRLWHDLTELGDHFRLGPNTVVLSTVLVALPLFIGGDVIWAYLWVFALAWAYMSSGQKVIGALGLLAVAAVPTVVEFAYRELTRPPDALLQAAAALEQRRFDPQALEELSSLADLLGQDPDFRTLQGDSYRQFGNLDSAAWAYREGLHVNPTHAAASLGLGIVQYLQGDFNAALQSFQIARDNGADPVVANYNLSLTFAHTYHFRESDEAIARARAADGARLQELTRGADQALLQPTATRSDVHRLVGRTDPVLLLNRGLLPPPVVRERSITHPLALAALAAFMIALAHYVARQHWTGFAVACVKCGRPFCRRCKLSQESQSYCTQCVNIFLKKDMVAIEAQMAKRRQLGRFQRARWIERRAADLLVPGLGVMQSGRLALGSLLMVVSLSAIALALVWLPRYLAPALMLASIWPLEAILIAVWGATVAIAQTVPSERR
ncbi:MAG: tetratricopeptide repeat protein [Acidobacteriota bacterium]